MATNAGAGVSAAARADVRPTTDLPDREPTVRVIPMPADANHTGDAHGEPSAPAVAIVM